MSNTTTTALDIATGLTYVAGDLAKLWEQAPADDYLSVDVSLDGLFTAVTRTGDPATVADVIAFADGTDTPFILDGAELLSEFDLWGQ